MYCPYGTYVYSGGGFSYYSKGHCMTKYERKRVLHIVWVALGSVLGSTLLYLLYKSVIMGHRYVRTGTGNWRFMAPGAVNALERSSLLQQIHEPPPTPAQEDAPPAYRQ
jgi:hypothetical protein